MGTGSVGLALTVLLIVFPRHTLLYNPLYKPDTNCSHLCTCNDNPMESTMKHYNEINFGLMGEKFRPELKRFDPNSQYMVFMGIFAPILHRIATVSCELTDGLSHSILSLLNGMDEIMYTALDVKCQNGENLVWDIPSWSTSFNIFISDNCTIVPSVDGKHIVLPMNLWIIDISAGGLDILEKMDLKFTMNTLALTIRGSNATTTPRDWHGKYMLSAAVISLPNNSIERFECYLQFTHRLDTLNLESNKLTRFPECVLDPRVMHLNYLSLADNRISDLSPIFKSVDTTLVPDIRIINLSKNEIRGIEPIRDMGSLAHLDLSHNFIKELPDDAFVNLRNLERLYLSHNRLHMMGLHAFIMNFRLEYIDLSRNALTSLTSEQFPEGRNQIHLDLRYNKLVYPPFKDCSKRKSANISFTLRSGFNPYICDCGMVEFEKCVNWLDSLKVNGTTAETVYQDMRNMKCSSPYWQKGMALGELYFMNHCIISENCPFSCSCTVEKFNILLVNCSSRRLLEMPDTLPSYPNKRVNLYLDHNPLQMLSYRSYLHRLSELHMHNCLLTFITPAAIAALENIRVLTLHNNLLQKLPRSTRNITLNYAVNVTLHDNRWACSCDSLWLPQWISQHKSALWMPGNIVCDYLRKPVEDLSALDLNCKSSNYFLETFLMATLIMLTIFSSIGIAVCYRSEITVLVFSKLGLRLKNSFSYGDCFTPYDAFISYSQDNFRYVVDTLVPHIEKLPQKYRLCLHYRDFPYGESVVDNLPWAIRLSRCSILVLNKGFLQKEWSIMEVRASFQRLLLVSNKLIIIVTNDVCVDDLPPELRAYMNTHDYLRTSEACFWQKLEMFLPPKPKTARQHEPGPTTQGNTETVSDGGAGDYMPRTSEKNNDTCSEVSDVSYRPGDTADRG